MAVNPDELLDFAQAELESYDPVVTQNSRGEIYFNPRALAAFDSTVVTPTDRVGFKPLSEKEIALYFVEGEENSVPFKRAKNKRTGSCSFNKILLMKAFLKVARGRKNVYSYRIDTVPNGNYKVFVLLIEKPKVARTHYNTNKTSKPSKRAAAKAAKEQAPSEKLEAKPGTSA